MIQSANERKVMQLMLIDRRVIALIFLTLANSSLSAATLEFPEDEWSVAEPAVLGIDEKKLAQAIEALRADLQARRGNLENAVLIHDGRIVWQTSAAKRKEVAHIWSATKSLSSTVLGAMIDREMCRLDTRASDHLPQLKERYADVTLSHLFTMTSAIRIDPKTPLGSQEPFGKPGTVYGYDDRNINVGGQVLERIGRKRLDKLFDDFVGRPIGMRIDRWGSDAAFGAHASAHDLARFGYLFLNRGRWKDQLVISRQWVELATSVQVPPDTPHAYGKHMKTSVPDPGRYGMAWWLNGVMPTGKRPYPDAPHQLWKASGWKGNRLFVIPDWHVVFVVLNSNVDSQDDPQIFNAFFKRLRPALNSNPDGESSQEKRTP